MWGQLIGTHGTYDLNLQLSRIGRTSAKCDIVIPKPWISGLQCTIELRGSGDNKTVWLKDLSSNGVYINGEVVGKSLERQIQENDDIYFTKPNLNTSNVEPTIFKLKLVNSEAIITPTKLKRRGTTPESKSLIDSAKKLCVSSSIQRDELISGTEAMQRANQELRQRLVDAGKCEAELKEQLESMLVTIQEKQPENDKLQEELTKSRTNALEDEHRRQEFEAAVEKAKFLESKCADMEVNIVKDKELHKQTEDELSAAQRNIQNLNNVVAALKDELEEAMAKNSATTQKARQMEVEIQKLQHQVDTFNRLSDNEQESNRGAKEEMLVMKARFASAREAFHQMKYCMDALGAQIEVHEISEVTEEEEEEAETQCVLTDRFSMHHEDENDDTTFTEATIMEVEEEAKEERSTTASPIPSLAVETNKRWLQLRKDSPIASGDDCDIFDESQDVRAS